MSNEQAVRQIVDGMPGLILTATAAGATEFVNQQLLAYFDKTLEEALATSMVLPESAVTYAVDDPEHAIRVGALYGIRILSPSESQRALPQYPGFGMPVR